MCFYSTQPDILLCGITRGNKNKLRTFQPQKWKKIKNSRPQTKFTGSYKKKECIVIKIVRMKIKEKKRNKISTELILPKIKHELINMISKYQNRKLYFGKTRAILNQISAVNCIYV